MPKIIIILRIINNQLPTTTSSRPDVFCKKGVLRNFAKITGKQLCQSLCFNKVADQACNFIKIETLAQVFSCEFCEIFKNNFFYKTRPVWLLLDINSILICLICYPEAAVPRFFSK